jgi:hypothetical protein
MNNLCTKNNLSAGLAGFVLVLAALAAGAQSAVRFGGLPLYFEANTPAHFLARGNDAQLSISPPGAQLLLRGSAGAPARALELQFTGASPQAQIRGDSELPGKVNYFTGANPAQWHAAVPIFAKVRVDEIYPGVNLVYYGNSRQIEYDLTVAAGASPDLIALHFDGADEIATNGNGELVLKLGGCELIQPKAVFYQMAGNRRMEIAGGYKILDSHTVAFAIGSYNHALPLVIDPILSYATYFGGTAGEAAWAVAVNPNDGSIYIAGQTLSKQFLTNGAPFSTTNAYQNKFGGGKLTGDAFVARFDNLGQNLIYLTYLGGSGDDGALGLAVDSAGNAFVTGWTDSPNFPTSGNAVFRSISGQYIKSFKSYLNDAFVTELDPSGSKLVYSTYLGGSSIDVGIGIAVDAAENAYVTGYSYSTNFPVKNPIQKKLACKYSTYFNCNAFVSEIAAGGSALVFSTYLGGTNFDQAQGIALDPVNNIYVAGFTASTNFPTTNYIDQVIGTNHYDGHWLNGLTNKQNFADDAFLAKLAPSGANLEYSTLLGGINNDVANHVAVDAAGAAYVTGWTISTNFPDTVARDVIASYLTNNLKTLKTTNAFLTKITYGTNASIAYSATFGGSRSDIGFSVAVDPVGDAFVTGASTSTNFPCSPTNSDGFLRATNSGGSDVFVTAFNPDASAVLYSILLGGKQYDAGYGIAVDPTGNAYVVGQTISTNFPTVNAFQPFRNGPNDTFLAKILLQPQPALAITVAGGTSINLAWSAFDPEFILESRAYQASANWLAVPVTPVRTNGSLMVNLPATGDSLIFRLHKF